MLFSIFLGREITHDRDYSESVATQIDAEVNVFIQKAFLAAKKIVSTHKDALEAIAKHLMEKESIEHEEFYALIKTFNLKPTKIK